MKIASYRYVTPEDEKYINDASFKLSSLAHLREKEGALVDTTEGQRDWHIHNPRRDFFSNPLNPPKFPPEIQQFYNLANLARSSNVVIQNNIVRYKADERWIYCLSRKYRNIFLEQQGLTVCYEIDDTVLFGETLQKSAVDNLGVMKVAPIDYIKSERRNFSDGDFYNDEFMKPLNFFPEREVRISYEQKKQDEARKFIVIKSPESRALMRKIR